MNHYPESYIRYLEYFHGSKDYFECHEVLEEYWKEHPDSPYRKTWVGLIQVAVAMYHQRRENLAGAKKMLSSSIRLLSVQDLEQLGVDGLAFIAILKERLSEIDESNESNNRVYSDIHIPIKDQKLHEHIAAIRTDGGTIDPFIIHKHTLRDRSDVIAARQAEWSKRKQTH